MPFEPKLFADDGPGGDHTAEPTAHGNFPETRDWFPTAETLAEQLHDDAARLAARFPSRALAPFDAAALAERITVVAATRPEFHHEERTPLRRILRGIPLRYAAASILLTLGIGGLFLNRAGEEVGDPNAGQARAPQSFVERSHTVQTPSASDGGDALLAPQQFQSFSGAEQEAVLDLIEHEAQANVRISI